MKLHLSLLCTFAVASQYPLFAQDTPAPAAATPPTAPVPAPEPRQDPSVPADRLDLKWKTGGSWQSTHEDYVKRAKAGNVNLVFFGDSITQWWDWQDFKKRYGALGGVDFGIGGDKTQNLLWRIENGEMDGITPKVAVVLIGTNNLGKDSASKIAEAVLKIVSTIREKSPTTKVLLMGVFPRGWNANEVKWYDRKIVPINTALAKADDGTNMRFLDIRSELLEEDGTLSRQVLKDGLHPAGEGYRRWAEAMQPLLAEMLGLPKTETAAPALPAPQN